MAIVCSQHGKSNLNLSTFKYTMHNVCYLRKCLEDSGMRTGTIYHPTILCTTRSLSVFLITSTRQVIVFYGYVIQIYYLLRSPKSSNWCRSQSGHNGHHCIEVSKFQTLLKKPRKYFSQNDKLYDKIVKQLSFPSPPLSL